MGKLVFQVTGAFAEFERSLIRQRINAGLKRAVAQGKRLARPPPSLRSYPGPAASLPRASAKSSE
jgi:DNA invertase Pin-like site-specific DNA recombinase